MFAFTGYELKHKQPNKDILDIFNARTPLGRPAQTHEIVGAAIYLASDESGYVTGHTLNVDGGYAVR